MSPHNIHSFVGDLVAMAQAMDALPKVQAELDATRHQYDEAQAVIQDLQLRIIDYKNSLDEAKATTRKVEAERDDAELRFLEADDATQQALDVIKTFMGNAGDFLRTLEPPVPVVDPTPASPNVVSDTAGLSADPQVIATPDPFDRADEPMPVVSVSSDPTPTTADGGDGTSASGQSDVGEQSAPSITESSSASTNPIASMQDEVGVAEVKFEGVAAAPMDPTAAVSPIETGPNATSDGAETTTNVLVPSTTNISSPPDDDVGYHNEPDWSDPAWDTWFQRMNTLHGGRGKWPLRPANNAQ